MENKQKLREIYLKRRNLIPKALILGKSQRIARKIFKLEEIKNMKVLSVYLSMNKEVDTRSIINSLRKKGVQIVVPTYSNKFKKYFWAEFKNWQDLEKGPYGILQPKGGTFANPDLIEVSLIPGLAFSKDGVRLGYGKGVFDKLLSGSAAMKIGLAFDFQIADIIDGEKHDLLADMVVTEKRVLLFKR